MVACKNASGAVSGDAEAEAEAFRRCLDFRAREACMREWAVVLVLSRSGMAAPVDGSEEEIYIFSAVVRRGGGARLADGQKW